MSTKFPAVSLRVAAFVILGTALLARLDWAPIHYAWWHDGQRPSYAANYPAYMGLRSNVGMIFCPPCMPLAENFYFVYFEVEAGTEEQHAVLGAPYSGNPLLPDGPRFWWGQGSDRPWRDRPNRSLGLQSPRPAAAQYAGRVVSRSVLGGLHHAYARAA